MRTMLVPVDFTETSENTVNFAAEWSLKYGYDHIILFTILSQSVLEYVALTEGASYGNQDALYDHHEKTQQHLEYLRDKITEKTNGAVKVTLEISDMPLLRGLLEIIGDEVSPDMIVLGSNHDENSADGFVSDNIINITKMSPIRVLVVPNGSVYSPLKNVLVPCNPDSVAHLTRVDKLKLHIKDRNTQLTILNVDTKPPMEKDAPKIKAWEKEIHALFNDVPHDISSAVDKNIINGIFDFASKHDVDLIIALPGEHSFLYKIANKSISEGIYRNALLPVLILK